MPDPQPAIVRVEVRQLALPLTVPYRLSYRTFETFEPFLVIVTDEAGRSGFGEGHVSPGSSKETREGGWAHLDALARRAPGQSGERALSRILEDAAASPVASSALVTALEMQQDHPLLRVRHATRLPILTPTAATTPGDIQEEVDTRLAEGFRTLKIKVGKDVDADLDRVANYQQALGGRGTLRLDANRAFSREQGMRFASALDPSDIELFEQPCDSENWDANAAVAAVSTVPLMLDEPICSIADVDRAAGIPGVAFCKVKLKRFVSLTRLDEVLARIRERGMTPVLGDGLGCEPCCWMEACVAISRIDNAGEFNGFLKPRARLFSQPLEFWQGCVLLPERTPELDLEGIAAHTTRCVTFTA
jgi:L-alanine-DL-glutamate epimerase-like enolase superfamily enzyme